MRISFPAAVTAVAAAAAVAVVSLAGVTTAAAPAPGNAPATAGRGEVVVTDLPEGPREYLAEELCDKEPLPLDKAHLERLDGLGGA